MVKPLFIALTFNCFIALVLHGQCQESIVECDSCDTVYGVDLTKDYGCSYLTRGRPEYEDFCGGCDQSQVYASFFGGWSGIENLERKQIGSNPDYLGASLVDGGIFGAAVGQQWHPRLRTELEFTYRNNNAGNWFERQIVGGILQVVSESPSTGQVDNYTGMVNMVFDVTPRRTCFPNVYAGLGAGVSHNKGMLSTATDLYQIDDASFAWQALLGSNYALRSNLDLFTEYRYMMADNFGVNNLTIGLPLGDFEYHSHSVVVGLRVRR